MRTAIGLTIVSIAIVAPARTAAQSLQVCPLVKCGGGVITPGCTCTDVNKLGPPALTPPPGCDLDMIKKCLADARCSISLATSPPDCRVTKDHCESIPHRRVVRTQSGDAICMRDDVAGCQKADLFFGQTTSNDKCSVFPVKEIASADPNDKVGPAGVTASQFLLAGVPTLAYTIHFENLATASAPAQAIVITDHLDPAVVDLDTFALGPIRVGGNTLSTIQNVAEFSGGIDLRPDPNLFAQVVAGLDRATGIASWRLQSIDPATLRLTDDPLAGLLPPNVAPPAGEASVTFTVAARRDLSPGTSICNAARIVFDANAPIDTPLWCNTVDASAPESRVLSLPAIESVPAFALAWTGTDAGSGIAGYSVFVSTDGGPFVPLVSDTTDAAMTFSGEAGRTYGFYSIARDLAGNVEAAKTSPDTTTHVASGGHDSTPPTTTAALEPAPNASGWNTSNVVVTLTAVDDPGGSGVQQVTFAVAGAESMPVHSVVGDRASLVIAADGASVVEFFATDNSGNRESPRSVPVRIDRTPPVVTLAAAATVLWPPNGKAVSDLISGRITDSMSGVDTASASFHVADEYGVTQPFGDVVVLPDGHFVVPVMLEASRRGDDRDGRHYLITVEAADRAGNHGVATVSVVVPHDRAARTR